LASRPSAKPGSVSTKRLDEPPDAGPHVRWCERGRGNPAPYSIPHRGGFGSEADQTGGPDRRTRQADQTGGPDIAKRRWGVKRPVDHATAVTRLNRSL
jgi:hypothetical protein